MYQEYPIIIINNKIIGIKCIFLFKLLSMHTRDSFFTFICSKRETNCPINLTRFTITDTFPIQSISTLLDSHNGNTIYLQRAVFQDVGVQ